MLTCRQSQWLSVALMDDADSLFWESSPLLRGHLLRCSLRSSSLSADGASMAEFGPNSAIMGRVGSVVVYVAGWWSGCGS